ncbi:hypothetical protein [Parachryseolinea silvisoli]|uniref:hypothetical protein n=1 Tax=Parachryseolinea silvisoli TaxID=2873601 RepID=UPI002265EFED|nr:hypothetical protein [Parachryseolinea silvisoli]
MAYPMLILKGVSCITPLRAWSTLNKQYRVQDPLPFVKGTLLPYLYANGAKTFQR